MENNTSTKTKGRKAKESRHYHGRWDHALQLVCAVLMCVLGAGLFVWGFTVPPKGEIHPSVLMAGGEFLTFTGTIFGIDYRYKIKTTLDK